MPLPESGFNGEIDIARPGPRKAGGDRAFRSLYEGLPARIDEEKTFDRPVGAAGAASAVRTAITTILINAQDADDDVIDVQEGDRVRFADFRGVAQAREITRVRAVSVPGWGLDHIVLEAEPSG